MPRGRRSYFENLIENKKYEKNRKTKKTKICSVHLAIEMCRKLRHTYFSTGEFIAKYDRRT